MRQQLPEVVHTFSQASSKAQVKCSVCLFTSWKKNGCLKYPNNSKTFVSYYLSLSRSRWQTDCPSNAPHNASRAQIFSAASVGSNKIATKILLLSSFDYAKERELEWDLVRFCRSLLVVKRVQCILTRILTLEWKNEKPTRVLLGIVLSSVHPRNRSASL